MLAEQDGQKQWNDGLAPFITPQFRTEVFGYEHVPPEIEVPAAAESWRDGAGYDLGQVGGGAAISGYYNYSRGVDLSYEDRIFLSPARQACTQSDLTEIDYPPIKFYNSPTFGLCMLAGSQVYNFDLSSQTWVLRLDDTAGYNFHDIIEHHGILFAARGNSVHYKTSRNLITWMDESVLGDNYADYFAIRGNSSNLSALWRMYNQEISNTTDGTTSTLFSSNWSGSDEVGHSTETTTGMVTVNNDIFVFKKEGVYVYDGVAAQDLWKTDYITDTNGRNPFVWSDGLIYVTYGDRLLQFNPFNSDLTPIYPSNNQDSIEVRGEVTAVGGDALHLYIAVKNKAGNTYILKGRPGGGWHTMAYLGANDCDALLLVPAGIVHASNPVLVFGYGTAASYFILPRDQSHPDQDTNCRFESTGYVVGPYINFGAKSFSKFLNRGSILGDGISGGRPATLKYEIDRSGTEVTLVSATSDGITESDETSEVQFNQVRYILYLTTGDDISTPAIDSLALYATLNPPRKRIWRPVVMLSDSLAVATSAYNTHQPSAENLHDILFGAVTKRLTLTDDRANTYTVRLLDVNSAGKVAKTIGGKKHDAMGYQLTIVEIRTLNTNQTVGIYGEHAYGGGAVYAE